MGEGRRFSLFPHPLPLAPLCGRCYPPAMLAQALVEHAMLSSLAAAIERTSAAVEAYLRDLDTSVILGVAAVVGFLVWVSRR